MRIKKRRFITFYAYLMVLWIMLSSEAIYAHVYPWWDNTFKILVVLFGIGSIAWLRVEQAKKLIVYFTMLSIILLLWTIGGATVVHVLTILAKLVPIIFFCCAMKNKNVDLIRIVYSTIYYLVVLSLIFFILFDLNLLGIAPTRYIWELDNGYQYIYTNYLGIYFRWHRTRSVLGINMISANGIWHEPGAYQIYANLGLFFALFTYSSEKKSKCKAVVFTLAVISSTSTMGLLLMAVLYFIHFGKKISIWKIIVIIIAGCLVTFFSVFLLAEKMGTANWLDRTGNWAKGFSYILKSPIFGYDIGNAPLYSGFLSYFVLFGILGCYPVFVFLKGVWKRNVFGQRSIDKIAISAWYILSMMNENYAYFSVIFLIYGICTFFVGNGNSTRPHDCLWRISETA